MSFQSSLAQQKASNNCSIKFALKLLPLTLGTLISASASAGFPTLYGKVYLTASQYDLEKMISR